MYPQPKKYIPATAYHLHKCTNVHWHSAVLQHGSTLPQLFASRWGNRTAHFSFITCHSEVYESLSWIPLSPLICLTHSMPFLKQPDWLTWAWEHLTTYVECRPRDSVCLSTELKSLILYLIRLHGWLRNSFFKNLIYDVIDMMWSSMYRPRFVMLYPVLPYAINE